MALISMLSAKGSPGTSTAALAMSFVWPHRVLLVEADPAGADSHAGLLRAMGSVDVGLLQLAMNARAGTLNPAAVHRQTVRLDEAGEHLLLPGLVDPAQSAGVHSFWEQIVPALRAVGGDVIADCGRYGAIGAPVPLWQDSDLIIMVLRPLTTHVHLARLRLRALAEQLVEGRVPAHERLALLLVDDPRGSELSAKDVIEHTRLPGLPPLGLLGILPADATAGAVMSGRIEADRRFERGQFMRTAAQIARNTAAAAATHASVRTAPARTAAVPTPDHRYA